MHKMDSKFFVFMSVLFAVCYGQVTNNLHRESTSKDILMEVNINETNGTINNTLTPILQNSYENNDTPRVVVIGVPIVSLLLIVCCVYFCCRCRTQRNQGMVMTVHPPPHMPAPATQIVIQQHAAAPQTAIPPPYPPQQHVPPPYDTQPTWGPPPPQQQYHQQAPPPQQQYQQQPPMPTSYVNPNYDQPPVNMQYGQEKY